MVTYDGVGNVSELIETTVDSATGLPTADYGTIAAHYEYNAYGDPVVATGPYAVANPFRFSTKYYDTETALYYFGYRYYSPSLGRWLSQDPIAEQGGFNLNRFANNSPTNVVDVDGRIPLWLIIPAVLYFGADLAHAPGQDDLTAEGTVKPQRAPIEDFPAFAGMVGGGLQMRFGILVAQCGKTATAEVIGLITYMSGADGLVAAATDQPPLTVQAMTELTGSETIGFGTSLAIDLGTGLAGGASMGRLPQSSFDSR